jgi:hypothetical protein
MASFLIPLKYFLSLCQIFSLASLFRFIFVSIIIFLALSSLLYSTQQLSFFFLFHCLFFFSKSAIYEDSSLSHYSVPGCLGIPLLAQDCGALSLVSLSGRSFRWVSWMPLAVETPNQQSLGLPLWALLALCLPDPFGYKFLVSGFGTPWSSWDSDFSGWSYLPVAFCGCLLRA